MFNSNSLMQRETTNPNILFIQFYLYIYKCAWATDLVSITLCFLCVLFITVFKEWYKISSLFNNEWDSFPWRFVRFWYVKCLNDVWPFGLLSFEADFSLFGLCCCFLPVDSNAMLDAFTVAAGAGWAPVVTAADFFFFPPIITIISSRVY